MTKNLAQFIVAPAVSSRKVRHEDLLEPNSHRFGSKNHRTVGQSQAVMNGRLLLQFLSSVL